jgi:hypothetical protein
VQRAEHVSENGDLEAVVERLIRQLAEVDAEVKSERHQRELLEIHLKKTTEELAETKLKIASCETYLASPGSVLGAEAPPAGIDHKEDSEDTNKNDGTQPLKDPLSHVSYDVFLPPFEAHTLLEQRSSPPPPVGISLHPKETRSRRCDIDTSNTEFVSFTSLGQWHAPSSRLTP